MREIEFRGKVKRRDDVFVTCTDKKDGEWVFGDLEVHRKGSRALIHLYNASGDYYRQYDVDPDTVGQFTGLRDKNGKRVFEGDVVHVVWQDPMFSQWHERTVLVEFKWGRFTVYQSKPFEHSDKRYFEVIGNIYDNPELLDNKG